MTSSHRILFSSLSLVFLASAAQAAGSVSVEFIEPDRYADARDAHQSASDNLRLLAAHIESAAGQHLADGDRLTVEVLDVDLAGELRPSRPLLQDVRVLKGGADWPRITLRYTLESAGRSTRSGDQTIRDMAYLQRSVAASHHGDALAHEKRMLDAWFQAHLAPRSAP